MTRARHTLITKDVEAMTGECAVCGPVALSRRSGGVACRVAHLAGHAAYNVKRVRPPSTWNTRKIEPHGLTVEEARQYREAHPLCEICGEPSQVVDHCHTRESIRGALCRPCNIGLGGFRDNAETLRAAAEYIERHHA